MKRILVRIPDGRTEAISTFPLLHELNREFEECSIFVLTNEENGDVFSFLPFRVIVKEIPLDKQTLLGLHHYAMNLDDVFNIDIFFDLIGDLKSTYLGRHFKPTSKVGYANGLNKFFLSKAVAPDNSFRMDSKHLHLLESYLENKNEKPQIVGYSEKSKPENFFGSEEVEPYLVFRIDEASKTFEYRKFWLDSISEFKGHKIVLWASDDDIELNSMLEELDESYNVTLVQNLTTEEMKSLIVSSQGVFTTVSWIANLSTYLAKDSFLFTSSIYNVPYLECFECSPTVVEYDGIEPRKIISSDDSKIINSMEEFADFSIEKLKL